MSEDLCAHISLDLGAHNVSLAGNIELAPKIDQHESHKDRTDNENLGNKLLLGLIYKRRGDVTHHKREHQCDARRQHGKKQVGKENAQVRPVIRYHFSEI